MEKNVKIVGGLILSLIGFYYMKSDWGFLILMIGSYLFFNNIKGEDNEKR